MGLTFIASATASSSATLSFTSGIDSTYNEYQFYFVNMHPASEDGENRVFMFQVNASDDTGGGFDTSVITSTYFDAYQNEAGSSTSLGYRTAQDQAQGTAYQPLMYGAGADNDQSCSGVLTLYAPASTTYVKHFTAVVNGTYLSDYSMNARIAGYINQPLAIPEISFKFNGSNIDAGTIYMYGVS
tara:strand:+ start:166 stop:720 length:555 start_codon:yes stop_codon:yes gene_type:complete